MAMTVWEILRELRLAQECGLLSKEEARGILDAQGGFAALVGAQPPLEKPHSNGARSPIHEPVYPVPDRLPPLPSELPDAQISAAELAAQSGIETTPSKRY